MEDDVVDLNYRSDPDEFRNRMKSFARPITSEWSSLLAMMKAKLGQVSDILLEYIELDGHTDVTFFGVPDHPYMHGKRGRVVRRSPVGGHFVVEFNDTFLVVCVLYLFAEDLRYTNEIRLGEMVLLRDPRLGCKGWVEWLHYKQDHYQLGIRLQNQEGHCDGTTGNGIRLFSCEMAYGYFCRSDSVTHVIRTNASGSMNKFRFGRPHGCGVKKPKLSRNTSRTRSKVRHLFNASGVRMLLDEHFQLESSHQSGLLRQDFVSLCGHLNLSDACIEEWWEYLVGPGAISMHRDEYRNFMFEFMIEDIQQKVQPLMANIEARREEIEHESTRLAMRKQTTAEKLEDTYVGDDLELPAEMNSLRRRLSDELSELEIRRSSLEEDMLQLEHESARQLESFVSQYVRTKVLDSPAPSNLPNLVR